MVVAMNSTSLAAEATNNTQKTYNLNEMDLENSFSETNRFITPEGVEVFVTNSFEPERKNMSRGSDVDDASVGTWKTSVTWGVFTMSYKFDMYKPSAGAWGVRNPHDLNTSGMFIEVIDKDVSVVRGVSNSSFPAKVSGTALVSLFDNQWIQIAEVTYIVSVSVSSGGVVTTEW